MQLIGKVRTGKGALASIPLCALEAPLLAPHLLHGLGAHPLSPLHGARVRLMVLLFRLIFLHVARAQADSPPDALGFPVADLLDFALTFPASRYACDG